MDKKELKKLYAQTPRPMGIYQVRNLTDGKIFIDRGINLQGKINGCRFQLVHGSHPNKALQADFDKTGADNFAFEIIDRLEPKEDIKADYTEDLQMLEEIWIDKLRPFGEKGYNQPKTP